MKENLEKLMADAYELAAANGWYAAETDTATQLALILSEVGELINADRAAEHERVGPEPGGATEHGLLKTQEDYMWCNDRFIGSIEEELADIILRCFDCLHRQGSGIVWHGGGYEYAAAPGRRRDLIRGYSVPELAVAIARALVDGRSLTVAASVSRVIGMVWTWSEAKGMDMAEFLSLKLRYNSYRGERHGGKRY